METGVGRSSDLCAASHGRQARTSSFVQREAEPRLGPHLYRWVGGGPPSWTGPRSCYVAVLPLRVPRAGPGQKGEKEGAVAAPATRRASISSPDPLPPTCPVEPTSTYKGRGHMADSNLTMHESHFPYIHETLGWSLWWPRTCTGSS